MKQTLKMLIGLSILVLSNNALALDTHKTIPDTRRVWTDDEYKPHIGIIGGVVIPEGSYDSDGELGFDIGFQPLIPFGLGLQYTTTNLNHDGGGNLNRNNLLLKATFNFGGNIEGLKDSYVGFGLGPSFNETSTHFAFAALLGFDIPLSKRMHHNYFSLGAQAKYTIYDTSEPNALSLSAILKFWF